MSDEPTAPVRNRRARMWRAIVATVLLALLALVGIAWHDTMAEPRVRHLTIVTPELAPETPPVRLVLLSDVHVAGPDMPPSRLARIVRQVNGLRPDLVLMAGDFISDRQLATRHYPTAEAVAPLGRLQATLGVVAVAGNHDHWRDAGEMQRQLQARGVTVLANQAQRFGPLAIGGLDDDFTGRADLRATLATLAQAGGLPIILSHSPDPFPNVPPAVGLMLAGHTHCGQIRYPWGGTPATMSRYGDRYACGMKREEGKVLVTTGGLGTSVLPFRFGTQPEIWLIELRPSPR